MFTINVVSILLVFLLIFCRGEPGKKCDPAFYDKILKPYSDVIEIEYSKSDPTEQRNAEENIKKIIATTDGDLVAMIQVPPDTDGISYIEHESKNLLVNKGCNGRVLNYLTCDPILSICICKTTFPFNNTEIGTKCKPKAGSICAIYNRFQVPCEGYLACAKDGYPPNENTLRFCGGVYEFEEALWRLTGGATFANLYLPLLITSTTVVIGLFNNI